MTAADVPDTMPAAYVNLLGGPEMIVVGTLPVPKPGPTDVLVEVDLAAVNPVDAMIRSGRFPTATPFPFVVGRDLVGTVAALGDLVSTFQVGERVWCNSLGHDGRQGSFARYAVVDIARAYRLPDGVDPAVAVAVAHPAATAYLALFVHAGLKPGQSVYIGGAAGNVGRAATQIALAAGSHVVAGARASDLRACLDMGAGDAVDFTDEHLGQRIRQAVPDGVDVFWNTSAHHDVAVAAEAVRVGGRMLVTAAGEEPIPVPLRPLYTRDVSVHGFAISRAEASDLADAAVLLNRMLAAGTLTARIDRRLPLADTRTAHELIESGTVRGRILVTPR